MKRISAVILALSLVLSLAACKQNSAPSAPPAQSQSQPSVESVQPPAESSNEPESVPEPEPEPEPELEVAFLTGQERTPDYPQGQRVVGIMVNNRSDSWPFAGISEAKVLFEIKVEGGITRFMAMYEDYKKIPRVGSIRSARDQFMQLLLPFKAFYVHDGPDRTKKSHPVNQMLEIYDYWNYDLIPNLGVGFRRREERSGYPDDATEFTDANHVIKAIEKGKFDDQNTYNSPIFGFVPYNQPARIPETGDVPQVTITHSSGYRTRFDYNTSSNRYEMSRYFSKSKIYSPCTDENNGVQVAFDNVVVLFAPMKLYTNSELNKVDYYGGIGYYFYGGKYELIRWMKGAPDAALRLYQLDGETTCLLNPGTTYVGIVDDDELEKFDALVKQTAGQ